MDKINHPTHYKGAGVEGRAMLISAGTHTHLTEIECIQVIESYELDYHMGNAFKYVYRAGKKDNVRENFEKALWYLKRREEREEPIEYVFLDFFKLKNNLEIWLAENP
jgi:hypothetical protein